MREPIKDKGRLEHILSAISGIEDSLKKYSIEDIQTDPIVFYGFVKYVEIIGEAVYMLSKEFKLSHPDVEWEVIQGMRHVLVHGYYQIKPSQLINTISFDIPQIKPIIERLFKEVSI